MSRPTVKIIYVPNIRSSFCYKLKSHLINLASAVLFTYNFTSLFEFLRRSLMIFFLSLRVFELLSSSLLLFPQRFGRYVLRPSSGVCRTREPTRNFELRPLLNPREGCSDSVNHNWVQVLRIPVMFLACSQD